MKFSVVPIIVTFVWGIFLGVIYYFSGFEIMVVVGLAMILGALIEIEQLLKKR